MAGFLMIEGGDDDLKKIPEIAAAEEVDLSFHEMIIGISADNFGTVPAEGVPGENLIEDPDDPNYNPYARNPIHSLFSQEAYLQYTLNGKAIDAGAKQATETSEAVAGTPPEITLRPGEVQRWNLGLLCHLQTYRLAIHNDDATAAGIPLRVAAWDGVTADQLESYDELVLGPADRVDLLIKAPSTPGTYHLKMLYEQFGNSGGDTNANEFPVAFDELGNPTFWIPAFTTPGVGVSELNMLTINVEGDVNEMALPASLNPPTKRLPYILDHEITRHRTIEFKVTGQVGVDFNPDAAFPITDNRKFFVNNLHFSGSRINETMLLGTAEEWTITNIHTGPHQFLQINHPFHIHVNWFQVMEIHHPAKDGHDAYVEKPNNGRGRWVDTIDVPFGGKTIIRHRFENYAGIFPLHCHVIAHEDEGMMHLCEVIDPTPVSATIMKAGGGTLMSLEKRAFSTTADSNGLLTVQEGDARVKVAFPAGAFDDDELITYAYQLDPEADAGTGASGETLIGLERYFDLYSSGTATLNDEATVTIDYPSELSHGQTYDADSVKLYRYDETQTAWTTDGIVQVSKDDGLLVSTINNTAFKSEYFAVLATQLTGPVTEPTTSTATHDHG
jgi:FtsP/CotA-like multicopper oxidase with cupredoxin domain